MSERVYAADEVAARLAADLPAWRFADGSIRRSYQTSGWKSTLMTVNAIGHLAEAAWHHPDLIVSYPAVEVRLSTHSAGGITDKDFALAAKIEELVTWRPSRDSGPLEGPPKDHEHVKHDG
jgi:4a-hydroxytetrahydrobiopterin dehydratase